MRLSLLSALLGALICAFSAAFAATPDDIAEVRQKTETLIASLDAKSDCEKDWYKTPGPAGKSYCDHSIGSVVFRKYSNNSKNDAFVFFVLGGCCGGSNVTTYLAVFSDSGNGYVLIDHAEVGGSWSRVDTSYLRIVKDEIILRLAPHSKFIVNGPFLNSYFSKWRLVDGRLVEDSRVYAKFGNNFREVKPNAP